MPVKEKDNFVSDLLTLLAGTLSRYIFSSYYVAKDKYSKFTPIQLRICTIVYLYLIFVEKYEKKMYFESFFVINKKLLLCPY